MLPDWQLCRLTGDALQRYSGEETPGKWSASSWLPSDRPAACGLTRVWRVWSRCKPATSIGPPEDAEGRADGCRSLLSAVQSLSLAGSAGLQHRGSLLWPLGRETPNSPALIVESELAAACSTALPSCSARPTGSPTRLVAQGVRRGHRWPSVLPQRFETAVAHIAIQQIGAVAMPLSLLFGAEALEYRLRDSGAVLAIVACEALGPRCARQAALRGPASRDRGGGVVPTSRPSWKRSAGSTPCRPEEARVSSTETLATDPALLLTPAAPPATPKGALIAAGAGGQSAGLHRQPELVWFRPRGRRHKPSDAAGSGRRRLGLDRRLMDALLPSLYFWTAHPAYQGASSRQGSSS